uniref:Transcriptional coactivator Hfi1/Transcriptional adapter 1 n=1 Tax=Oryza glumipatula TaxID=40148 RepID=A0A0D9ZIE8_9ORYZ
MPSSTPPSVQPAPTVQPLPSSTAGQSTRIDLREIKSNIIKRIGPGRAKKYFQHLERFLSSKLNKNEFDKLCLVTLGRENLPLHNHLIRSILHNACRANGPPAIDAPKLAGDVSKSEQILHPVWNNGNVSIQHVKDNRSLTIEQEGAPIIRENGAPNFSDLKRRQQVQNSEHAEPRNKRLHYEKEPPSFLEPSHSNGPSAISYGENSGGENIHRIQGPVRAPLGIQFSPVNFGGIQKSSTIASVPPNDSSVSCYELGELCDTMLLSKRMEKIAEAAGLEGVSVECANLLNNGVDVFLKQLIGSCVQLVGTRSQLGKLSHASLKQQLSHKLINGISLKNHVHGQGIIIPTGPNSISIQDLKAVSELSPHLLGVNASLLREKINSYD